MAKNNELRIPATDLINNKQFNGIEGTESLMQTTSVN
jgi:hypothetical protein